MSSLDTAQPDWMFEDSLDLLRPCHLCCRDTEEAVQSNSLGDFHISCMTAKLVENEKVQYQKMLDNSPAIAAMIANGSLVLGHHVPDPMKMYRLRRQPVVSAAEMARIDAACKAITDFGDAEDDNAMACYRDRQRERQEQADFAVRGAQQ